MTFLYVLLGLIAGVLSGIVGIGGGVVIVPVLIYAFGMSQLTAQGTTVALLVPPLGFLAALTYYKHGHVNLTAAALIALGIFFGSYLGATVALELPEKTLTKLFGFLLLAIAIRMILTK